MQNRPGRLVFPLPHTIFRAWPARDVPHLASFSSRVKPISMSMLTQLRMVDVGHRCEIYLTWISSGDDTAEMLLSPSEQPVDCKLKTKSVCQQIARNEVQFSAQTLLVLPRFATICLSGSPLSRRLDFN